MEWSSPTAGRRVVAYGPKGMGTTERGRVAHWDAAQPVDRPTSPLTDRAVNRQQWTWRNRRIRPVGCRAGRGAGSPGLSGPRYALSPLEPSPPVGTAG